MGGGGVCRDPGLCLVTGMSSGTFPQGAQGIKAVLESLDSDFVAFFWLLLENESIPDKPDLVLLPLFPLMSISSPECEAVPHCPHQC